MARYAAQTTVSTERSKAEIESLIARYGATKFATMWDDAGAMIQFKMCKRVVRFNLPLPERENYRSTPGGKRQRDDSATIKAWEQGCRQCWRALLLTIKAKLESIESEIEVFDEAFLAQIVQPNGQTVGQFYLPQIEEVYERDGAPLMLPGVAG